MVIAGMLVGMTASAVATAMTLARGQYLLSLVIWNGGALVQQDWSGVRVLAGVLAWSVIAKAFFRPALWTQEMAQFTMIAYVVLGGAYSLMGGAHVRMDLLYSRWSARTRAAVDCVTVFALIVFLGVVLWGGIESTIYALEIGERSRTVWRPYMAPVKIVICLGTFLMLLQSLAFLLTVAATMKAVAIPRILARVLAIRKDIALHEARKALAEKSPSDADIRQMFAKKDGFGKTVPLDSIRS